MIDAVLIIGGGTCGCQIAWQCALHGVAADLVEVDRSHQDTAAKRLQQIAGDMLATGVVADTERQAAETRIRLWNDCDDRAAIDRLAASRELILESVPEQLALKRELFARYSAVAAPTTILATNSSYLLPSSLIRSVTHPERLASLHFHVPVWIANAVDVMPHSRTSPETVARLVAFAQQIGQVPIRLQREQPGYVFNTLLNPLLTEAIRLARRGVAEPQQIDLAWRTVTKMPVGPFDMIRLIGQQTVSTILRTGAAYSQQKGLLQDADFLDQLELPAAAPLVIAQPPATLQSPVTPQPPAPRQPASVAPLPAARPQTDSDTIGRQQLLWHPAPLDQRIKSPLRLAGPCLICGPGATQIAQSLQTRFPTTTADCRITETWPTPAQLQGVGHWVWHVDQLAVADDSDFLMLLQSWWRERIQADPSAASTLTLVAAAEVGLAGLARALSLEVSGHSRWFPAIRLLEYDRDADQRQILQSVSQEIAISQNEVLVGDRDEAVARYCGVHVRYVGQTRCRPVFQSYLHCDQQTLGDQPLIDAARDWRGTRWLVIGGGRGITFEKALWLGQHARCTLDLVGRSPLIDQWDVTDDAEVQRRRSDVMRTAYRAGRRPDEAWAGCQASIELTRNLQRLQRQRIAYRLHPHSVSHPAAVETLAAILTDGPPVAGVIYGAGWEKTTRFEKKTGPELQATVDSKLTGLQHLLSACQRVPAEARPRMIVVSGSLAGRFGGVGQIDYAHTNSRAMELCLSTVASWPATAAVVIDWPGWQQIGMAARSSSQFMLQRSGHQSISVADGVRAFASAITSRSSCRITLIAPQEIPLRLRAPETLVLP